MSLKDIWSDKVGGIDVVLADDINSIAHAVIDLEEIDTEMSDTSNNAVQNKVIKNYIDESIGDIETALDSKAENTDIDTLKSKSIPHTTASGYPLTVTDHLNAEQVIDYKVYGNSVQDGTPSIENPIEIKSVGDLVTDETSEYYGKYDVPITVRGKNLLPNSNWMSGQHLDGFTQSSTAKYITEYTQNSISFNLPAWTGVSSPRIQKDSIKKIVFKINQTALNSDSYINFYIAIQGYDDNNKKIGNKVIYDSAVADKKYVFDFSEISSYSFYANSTQFSFCILARKNDLRNLMVYDIAYYAETDTAVYEPYSGETKHIYLNEPLRKVGNYADYIDFKNQKVIRQIEVLDDTGAKTINESLGLLDTPTEEIITIPELTTLISSVVNVSTFTTIQPSNMDLTYYQDINKVIANLTNAIISQGGNI